MWTFPADERGRRVGGVCEHLALRHTEQAPLILLADLLDWHRRESKVAWWEFFRLQGLTAEELFDEKAGLSGLSFVERITTSRGIPTDRHSFEQQETEVRACDKLCQKSEKVGEVVVIDLAKRTVDIKKTRKTADVHPTSVFVDCTPINGQILADALVRLGEWVTFDGVDAPGPLRAGRDLLLCNPRIETATGQEVRLEGESALTAANRLVSLLQDSVLPVQGPPRTGKTFTGASMILELVRKGKRVGVTATSHTVVRNLLTEVAKAAAEEQMQGFKCLHKVTGRPEFQVPGIEPTTENAAARLAIKTDCHVTGWNGLAVVLKRLHKIHRCLICR